MEDLDIFSWPKRVYCTKANSAVGNAQQEASAVELSYKACMQLMEYPLVLKKTLRMLFTFYGRHEEI